MVEQFKFSRINLRNGDVFFFKIELHDENEFNLDVPNGLTD